MFALSFRRLVPVRELYVLQTDTAAGFARTAGEIHGNLSGRRPTNVTVLHIAYLYARTLTEKNEK